jgi:hypothetical protein
MYIFISKNLIDADSKLENLPLADSDIILVEYFDSQSAQLFLKKKIEFKEELCPGCNDVIKKILMKPCVCKDVRIDILSLI